MSMEKGLGMSKGFSVKARPTALSRVVRGSVVVVLAASVLAVSGCTQADTAAVVDGTKISEQDAQEAARQISAAQPNSGLDTANAVASLIMATFINRVAEQNGKGLSDSAARAAVDVIPDPTQATLQLVRASLAYNQMTSEEQAQAVTLASKADITINPRYGTFDAAKIAFNPSTPNWIKPQPAPAAAPAGG